MRDGIYKVTLESGGLKGLIIGTLCDGLVTGCDQSHHVTGYVRQQGSRHKGTMVLSRHARPEGFVEIANLDHITVNFSGICGDSFGQFDAKIAEKTDLPVKATFQWMCEL
jgi:glutamate synthase domain-containing protein 3